MSLTPPFEVVCINDKDRNSLIPTSMWVKEGKTYTVIKIVNHVVQGGLVGFKLAEIEIVGCYPYEYYRYDRFAPVIPDKIFDEIEELISQEQQIPA